jgi:hypothetical protein
MKELFCFKKNLSLGTPQVLDLDFQDFWIIGCWIVRIIGCWIVRISGLLDVGLI